MYIPMNVPLMKDHFLTFLGSKQSEVEVHKAFNIQHEWAAGIGVNLTSTEVFWGRPFSSQAT